MIEIYSSKIFLKKNPKLVDKPGTKFKYSNLGYVLLGQLIESVTGQDYEACVIHNIIEKAGIADSSLGFTIRESDHATGYQKSFSVGNALLSFLIDRNKFMYSSENGWSPFRNFYVNGTSYGGLIGSIVGLTKYAQVLMRKDSVLLDETHKEILFKENMVGKKPTGMSHAWFKGTLKGHVYAAHAGGGGGYYSELRIYPDLEVGSVIMFNRSGLTDERFLDNMDGYFLS